MFAVSYAEIQIQEPATYFVCIHSFLSTECSNVRKANHARPVAGEDRLQSSTLVVVGV